MIKLTKKEWNPIWERIKEDHPKSVWMLTYKLKDTLGFTVRNHHEDVEGPDHNGWMTRKTTVCLDFYDEQMEVYFRLKYL